MVRRSDALFFGGIAALGLAPVGLVVAVANLLEKESSSGAGIIARRFPLPTE